MAMEIKPTQTGITQPISQKPLQTHAATDMSNETTRTSTVTVTSAAEDLIEMERALSELAGVDEAKVALLKQQIEDEELQVDASHIAGKLIAQEIELL